MHGGDNKLKGVNHTAFLKKHKEVDDAKKVWIVVATEHMQAFYVANSAGVWSVNSIKKKGIHTIPKRMTYPPEAKAEYLRLHALVRRKMHEEEDFSCRKDTA
jgi:hypothetical protein